MKLASIQSRRQSIFVALQQVRQNTLDLLAEIDESLFYTQAHLDFSPIGWHFGHIAFTEAYWILEYLANSPLNIPEYNRLFAADGLPKKERQNLPELLVIQDYLRDVRTKVLTYLESSPIEQQERLWRWLIQHESQHNETIAFIWQLHQRNHHQHPDYLMPCGYTCRTKQDLLKFGVPQGHNMSSGQNYSIDFSQPKLLVGVETKFDEMVKVEAGEFMMGSDDLEALDNERPIHKIYLDTYWLDRYPVTCQQYHSFIMAGGYQKRQYWSQEGWQWLQQYPVSQPLYWSNSPDWYNHPVYGVSYYEAEAYANFAHKRLPTEAEWEKAAQGASFKCNHSRLIGHTTPVDAYPDLSKYGCQNMLGNVWEWTADWFAGYEGFASYPYSGYSEVYFDRQHRVLKGGSWTTHRAGLRTSFRNWYHPQIRQIFAGFRCARN